MLRKCQLQDPFSNCFPVIWPTPLPSPPLPSSPSPASFIVVVLRTRESFPCGQSVLAQDRYGGDHLQMLCFPVHLFSLTFTLEELCGSTHSPAFSLNQGTGESAGCSHSDPMCFLVRLPNSWIQKCLKRDRTKTSLQRGPG